MHTVLTLCLTIFVVTVLGSSHITEGDCTKECADECFWRGGCYNHTCRCLPGWSGETCQARTCNVENCLFGHCDTNDDGSPACVCHRGWAGDRCDVLVGVKPYGAPVCTPFGYCTCDSNGAQCVNGEMPDFVPIPRVAHPKIDYRDFTQCSCAVDARVPCAKPGRRKILRFTTEVLNVGNADLFVGEPADWNEVEDYPLWKYHACHKHQHFEHWIDYRLRRVDDPSFVLVGAKSGSSVLDSMTHDPHNWVRKYNEKTQGLQINWIDWYPQFLDCQWIDVTDMPLGDYTLEIIVNPNHVLRESNYTNNIAIIDIKCDPPCTGHGHCDFGHGCVCEDGWNGTDCNTPADGHVCQSHCVDKECGPDGCGSTCGYCPDNYHCNDSKCTCTPQCAGNTCGPDGCGGVCGECTAPNECSEEGYCVCIPRCSLACGVSDGCGGTCGCPKPWQEACVDNKCVHVDCTRDCQGAVCGHDGCGGSCGECEGKNMVCSHGECVCKPTCGGRHCGPDGCGGTCGTCAHESNVCSSEGQCLCTPKCEGLECGFNGCNGTCGECAEGEHCLNHRCVCQPNCWHKRCGDNGCGGLCSGKECESGYDSCDCTDYCGPTVCKSECACPAGSTCIGTKCTPCADADCNVLHDPIHYPLNKFGGARTLTFTFAVLSGLVALFVLFIVAASLVKEICLKQ